MEPDSRISFESLLLREIDLLKREIAQLRREAEKPAASSGWSRFNTPAALAVLGILGTIAGGVWQLHSGRELEREKLESSLVLRASESGDPQTTLRNLQFLVTAKLIDDPEGLLTNLTLDQAPAFVSNPPKLLAESDLKRLFGDPKLIIQDQASGDLAVPDEGWVSQNLELIEIPELIGIPGFAESGKLKFHRQAAPHLQAAFAEIAAKGLIGKVLSFDGAWVPRFMRGSGKRYSAHSFGIAFDINSRFNPLGKPPAPSGQEGSVVELVPILEKHGFFWGGNFKLPEGGHFQYGVDELAMAAASSQLGETANPQQN